MRICFVCNEYPPVIHGGIGTFTHTLARALTRAGHQVHVVGLYQTKYANQTHEDDDGVCVWRLEQPNGRFTNLRSRIKLFTFIRTLARDYAIDILEVPDWEGWAAFWPELPIPVVARLHGSGTHILSEQNLPVPHLRKILERKSLQRANAFAAVSEYIAVKTADLFNIKLYPLEILSNFIEFSSLHNQELERKPLCVIFSGTLNANKGILVLLHAWAIVQTKYPNAELHVFGKDGGLRRKAEQLAQGLNIIFHGHVPRQQLLQAYGTARVAVFPSLSESFGLAPLEAMYMGCTTIYTCRASGPELISNGIDGLLIEPSDPSQIAEAIVCVFKDGELSSLLANNGQKRVLENYTAEKILRRNVAFYSAVINSFGKKK